MKITVTQKDIDKGVVNNRLCPIAIAISRKTKYAPYVMRSEVDVYVKNEWQYGVALPKSAMSFIKKFDDEKKVKPFTFKLTTK